MKHIINLNEGGHVWKKQNLITQIDSKGTFDTYKCSGCGLTARSINLSQIAIDGRIKRETVKHCSALKQDDYVGRKIKITFCTANGKVFSNLTPGSIHAVVEGVKGGKPNGTNGVWVMGVGEPVKVLYNEFNFID